MKAIENLNKIVEERNKMIQKILLYEYKTKGLTNIKFDKREENLSKKSFKQLKTLNEKIK